MNSDKNLKTGISVNKSTVKRFSPSFFNGGSMEGGQSQSRLLSLRRGGNLIHFMGDAPSDLQGGDMKLM